MIQRPQELVAFKAHAASPKQLLFHGSKISNFVGILKEGLRIAPPEAPITGAMFGKGVYFANCSSKVLLVFKEI